MSETIFRERLQAIIDWADLAMKNREEFDSHGVRNLDGPVFDAGREALANFSHESNVAGDIAAGALALPLPVQESVPEGWQLVPVKADKGMIERLFDTRDWDATDYQEARTQWEKWLAAAPLSPFPSIPEEKGGTAESVLCPCTTFEQDEDCHVGYPSMLCSACAGTGNAPMDKVVALAAEMMKIAEQVDELEDPFAAWESIDLIKSQMEKASAAKPAIDAALTAMNRCVHDGGFDREIGPIGCGLGDKCVCIGVYPKVLAVADALRASPTEGQTVKEGSTDE